MRSKCALAFAAAFVVAGAALAQSSGGDPVFKRSGDLIWVELNPAFPGIRIVDLWGDHAKSGYGAFLEFPAGFLSPLHTHTSDIKIVVISGTYTQAPEGKPTVRLGPGSYAFQPGGNYKHISGCDKASKCLLFIESTGPFDLIPVEAPKPAM
jgi:anti-sigma factor ChrR (cupin superfamily)